MKILSTYIIKQTTRGENTKTALQSVGRAKGKGAACVRTSIKREAQLSKLSNDIGAVDFRRELRATNQRNERRAKR